MLSLAALLFRLSFVLAGPPIGALGMDAVFAVLAVVFTAAALTALFVFVHAHGHASVC